MAQVGASPRAGLAAGITSGMGPKGEGLLGALFVQEDVGEMKRRNTRYRQWKRWARREIRAGRTRHNGYGPFWGYRTAMHRHAKRGDWRKRFHRRWGWMFEEDA